MRCDRWGAARLALLAAWCAMYSGCANSPLYDEARDKQGQAAKKAAGEVDLMAVVEAQRARFKALSELEVETQKTRRAVSRDFVIEALVRSPKAADTPAPTIGTRYVEKVIAPRYRALTGQEPKLDGVDGVDGAQEVQGGVTAVAPSIPRDDTGEGIAGIEAALKNEERQLLEYRQRLQRYKRNLAEEGAKAAAGACGKTASEQLQSGAKELRAAIDGLRKQAAAQPFAHAEAQARLEALDHVLQALGSGTTDLSQLDDDERRAVLIVRLIPSLSDEAKRWEQASGRIRMAPLILAKEQQRLAVEGFQARLDVLGRIVALRRQALASARGERDALDEALRELRRGKIALDAPLLPLIDGDFKDGRNHHAQRYHLYLSFAARFDKAEQHRLDGELTQLAIDAAQTDMALEASRSAALQWQNLSTSVASVLGDYHASGLKTAEIAEFLQAFGLIHIGNNVGR